MSLYVPLAKTTQFPRRYYLSQGYHKFHTALDMVGAQGQKVLAAQSGIVFASSWEGDAWAFGGGNVVIIDHYGSGNRRSKTSYAHLLTRSVKKGQYVLRGQVIGTADNTGKSNGNHLHFAYGEAHANPALYYSYDWLDPRLYMAAHAYENGKQGAGSRVNSAFARNTLVINPHVNIRSGPNLTSSVLRTTGATRWNGCYLGTVTGTTWSGSNQWHKIWHPATGVGYVHSALGTLS